MSGTSVIRHLLAQNAAVLTTIPATRIMAGVLPLNTALPALSITQVSSVPFNFIRTNTPKKMHTDRVQVTALYKNVAGAPAGAGYPGLKAMLKLVLKACPSQRGTVNGVVVDSITPANEGPDIYDPDAQIHSCSRDFIVKWIATD